MLDRLDELLLDEESLSSESLSDELLLLDELLLDDRVVMGGAGLTCGSLKQREYSNQRLRSIL